MTTLRFTLTGEADEGKLAEFLDALYEPEHGDAKPDGCEEATFKDFAEMVLDHARGEFGSTPLKFSLVVGRCA